MTGTLFDLLAGQLTEAAGRYDPNDQVAPVAVLWPDGNRAWTAALSELRTRLPILTLGPYDPDAWTGPAIWIRCVLGGTVLLEGFPAGTPIIALPGYARETIRGAEDCPVELAPLVDLQYRGIIWNHKNGKDWTPVSWLLGAGVKVEDGSETRAALSEHIVRVFSQAEAEATSKGVSAKSILDLVNPDPVDALLQWISDPGRTEMGLGGDGFSALVQRIKSDCGLDLTKSTAVSAARELAGRKGEWSKVWSRFAAHPEDYPGVADALEQAAPPMLGLAGLDDLNETNPRANQAEEDALRTALLACGNQTAAEARSVLADLESRHGVRRGWVWAKLGQCQLAGALMHLVKLAESSKTPLPSGGVQEIAQVYAQTEGAWQTDYLAMKVIESVANGSEADQAAVASAVNALYREWVEQGAQRLQEAWTKSVPTASAPIAVDPGVCYVFADGLRMDLAHRLVRRLGKRKLEGSVEWRLAPVPTVTSTAKYALAPIGDKLSGGSGFTPAVKATGTSIAQPAFLNLLSEVGIVSAKTGQLGLEQTGWLEFGEVDRIGHSRGIGLAEEIPGELDNLARKIGDLLKAGWQEVRVITDHGWLLMPGGLTKAQAEVPLDSAEPRKGRAARLSDTGNPAGVQVLPWFWDPTVRIAIAPGAFSFLAGKDYDHGGISPQESVIPVVSVKPRETGAGGVNIASVSWTNLLCKVDLKGAYKGSQVDLRLEPGDKNSSVADSIKTPSAYGKVSIYLAGDRDDLDGNEVFVTVFNETGVLAEQSTIVGGG